MLYEKTGWFGGRKRVVGWGVAGLVVAAVAGGPAVGVSVLIVPIRAGRNGRCCCGKVA